MEIQFTFFLGIYFVGVLAFFIISLMNVYHLFKYAKGALGGKILMFAYFFVTIAIIAITALLIQDIDFSQKITIFDTNGMEGFPNPF
jgi:hypothetical protein